jgi:enterochelin esterase-like enzyme
MMPRERGSLSVHTFDSEVLRGNALGDPTERDLYLYLPPGYDATRPYPALLALVGFLGTGASLFNVDPLGEDLRRRLDRLITSGVCPPVIVAAPDCFTRVGGNQYINSSATGRYEDYLLQEVLPYVQQRHAVSSWGVFGKSSGGYGAMVLGMRHPEVFRALADHSGDADFELCYIPDFPEALDRYREHGGPRGFLERYWADENRHRKKWMRPINMLGMAASYSPRPASPHLGIDFPFDLETGELRWDVWQRWRAWDPVNMVEAHAAALQKLALVYVDCGSKDEFSLHWGARSLSKKLTKHGVSHQYEEFDDGHMAIAYRYDRSLPALVKALEQWDREQLQTPGSPGALRP